MSSVFPRWANSLPRLTGALGGFAFVAVVGIVWYYFTPEFWEVGYQPDQPVDYSHQLHVGKLGIDCRYCHSNVEESAHSNIPDTATCMNCHMGDVNTDQAYLAMNLWTAHKTNENLVQVRSAYATGEPIRWKRIHKVPDYAHFNHAVHINAGVSCYSCHGRIDQQEVVRQEESLSMAWCLDCHRAPEKHLVDVPEGDPVKRITNLEWVAQELRARQRNIGEGMALVEAKALQPPEHCGACHY
ncbi:MAG: cytochrome c3 family protein [Planctomycetota bacterium]